MFFEIFLFGVENILDIFKFAEIQGVLKTETTEYNFVLANIIVNEATLNTV